MAYGLKASSCDPLTHRLRIWWGDASVHYITLSGKNVFLGDCCYGNGGHLGFLSITLRAAFFRNSSSTFLPNVVFRPFIYVSTFVQNRSVSMVRITLFFFFKNRSD